MKELKKPPLDLSPVPVACFLPSGKMLAGSVNSTPGTAVWGQHSSRLTQEESEDQKGPGIKGTEKN